MRAGYAESARAAHGGAASVTALTRTRQFAAVASGLAMRTMWQGCLAGR